MKQAFGMIELLISLCIIGVIFALMHSNNPIVEESARINVQKQKTNEMIEQVTELREKSIRQNNELIDSLDE